LVLVSVLVKAEGGVSVYGSGAAVRGEVSGVVHLVQLYYSPYQDIARVADMANWPERLACAVTELNVHY
jgi:hypothetical protein